MARPAIGLRAPSAALCGAGGVVGLLFTRLRRAELPH